MKKERKVKTTVQKAVWFPESQLDELYKLAGARGIKDSRRSGTIKNLIRELALEESDRIGFNIDENVMRYARMKVH